MTHEEPFRAPRKSLASDRPEGSRVRGWGNVRSRLQAALDALEDGDLRVAEAILLDLLADVERMGRAA